MVEGLFGRGEDLAGLGLGVGPTQDWLLGLALAGGRLELDLLARTARRGA